MTTPIEPTLCMCKDRPVDQCPGEWEPGCDLGANETFARLAPDDVSAKVDAALGIKRTTPTPIEALLALHDAAVEAAVLEYRTSIDNYDGRISDARGAFVEALELAIAAAEQAEPVAQSRAHEQAIYSLNALADEMNDEGMFDRAAPVRTCATTLDTQG